MSVLGYSSVVECQLPLPPISVDLSKLFCSVSLVTGLVLQNMESLPRNASRLLKLKGDKACLGGEYTVSVIHDEQEAQDCLERLPWH